jgi:hypothetical protein
MLRAYLAGARAAARRWPLIVILWLITATFGLAFALATAAWLSDALEGSLATRAVFRTVDPDVLIDLWYHHREGLRALLVLGFVLAAVHTVLWWWLDGVVISSLQRPGHEPLTLRLSRGGVWAEGLEVAPAMAQLFAIAIALLALFSGAVGGAAYALLRWTRTDPAAMIWYQIGGVAAAVWAIGCVFLVAVHDQARIRVCRARQQALPAYRWALGFVLRGGERAFPLACALQLTGVGLWLAAYAVDTGFTMAAALGPTGALLWGEAVLWLRLWVRVWFFAAQNELQL